MLSRPVSNVALRLAFAVLVGAPSALSGCGSASLDGSADPAGEVSVDSPRRVESDSGLTPVPLAELAERLAAVGCQALAACCQAAALGTARPDCQAQAQADYQAQLTAWSERKVRYDPIAGARCLAAFTRFRRSCHYDGKPESDAACAAMFRGTQGFDQSCDRDDECAPASPPGVYCAGDLAVLPNTCQPALLEGAPCLLEGCARGLFCDLETLTCQPQQTGGTCSLQFEACAEETVCSPNGMCEPLLAAGQPCQLDLQCGSGVCTADARCAGSIASAALCVPP
jgi:hypothetical protein